MADLTVSRNSRVVEPGEAPAPRPLPRAAIDARLVAMVELLFFAYRDFTAEPDKILSEIGFGRAHHRVLHFVNRNPGLRVADLLGVLRITKQSLARVLRQLVEGGFVQHNPGASDRRERRLHLTRKGRDLAERLLELQARRLADALHAAGDGAGPIAERFLTAMITAANRAEVRRLIAGASDRPSASHGEAE